MPDLKQQLVLEIEVDETGAVKSVKKLEKGIDNTKKKSKEAAKAQTSLFKSLKVGYAAVAAVITGVVVQGFVKLIKKASDAQETISKFNTVFAGVSKEANKTAKELADSFGLSVVKAKELLGATGDLLTGFGFTDKAALDVSKRVNQLSVDLASFTNAQGGAEAVSAALTKALLGERESLKTYGIAIREADIQTELFLRGQQNLTGEALNQAKAYITLDLALKQSGKAVGDFARTQQNLANQLRIFQARIDDLLVSLGTIFIPIATKVVIKLNEFLKPLKEIADDFREIDRASKGWKAFKITIEVIVGILKLGVTALKQFIRPFTLIPDVIKFWKNLGDTIVDTIKSVSTLGDVLNLVFQRRFKEAKNVAVDGLKKLGGAFKDNAKDLGNIYKTALAGGIVDAFNIVKKTTKNIQGIAKGAAEEAVNTENEKNAAILDSRKNLQEETVKLRQLTVDQIKEIEALTKADQFMTDEEKLQNRIEKLNQYLEQYKLTDEQIKAIDFARTEFQKQLEEVLLKKRLDALKQTLEGFSFYSNFIGNTASALTSLQSSLVDRNVKDEKQAAKKKAKFQRATAVADKIAGVIDVGINTAKAIMKGFAIFGPPPSPAGIAASIAAGIQGGIQAAAIAAKPLPAIPSFATGGNTGITPGVTNSNDGLNARLSNNENVFNAGQSRNLFNALETAGLLGGNASSIANTNINNNQNMSRQVNIDNVNVQGDGDFNSMVDKRLAVGGDFQ